MVPLVPSRGPKTHQTCAKPGSPTHCCAVFARKKCAVGTIWFLSCLPAGRKRANPLQIGESGRPRCKSCPENSAIGTKWFLSCLPAGRKRANPLQIAESGRPRCKSCPENSAVGTKWFPSCLPAGRSPADLAVERRQLGNPAGSGAKHGASAGRGARHGGSAKCSVETGNPAGRRRKKGIQGPPTPGSPCTSIILSHLAVNRLSSFFRRRFRRTASA